MSGPGEQARARALAEEAAITAAQERAAMVALAGCALHAADGDGQAAKAVLREVLETCGLLDYERGVPGKRASGERTSQ